MWSGEKDYHATRTQLNISALWAQLHYDLQTYDSIIPAHTVMKRRRAPVSARIRHVWEWADTQARPPEITQAVCFSVATTRDMTHKLGLADVIVLLSQTDTAEEVMSTEFECMFVFPVADICVGVGVSCMWVSKGGALCLGYVLYSWATNHNFVTLGKAPYAACGKKTTTEISFYLSTLVCKHVILLYCLYTRRHNSGGDTKRKMSSVGFTRDSIQRSYFHIQLGTLNKCMAKCYKACSEKQPQPGTDWCVTGNTGQ